MNNPLRYADDSGEDIKLAPGLNSAEMEYIVKGLTTLYATPTGKRTIDKLEANKKVVVTIGTKDLGAVIKTHGGAHAEGQSGETDTTNVKKGQIGVNVDPENQQELQKAGGNTNAQNLGHELGGHAAPAIDDPDNYGPNDDTESKVVKAVGEEEKKHMPVNKTREQVEKIVQ